MRMTKLYVHDDRLGPYARAYLQPFSKSDLGLEGLSFELEWPDGKTERWLLDTAIAPVYSKLRLPVRSLLTLAEFVGGGIERMVGPEQANRLTVDFRYERAGEYLSNLSGRVLDPSLAARQIRTLALSRWCAVARWYVDEEELLELVYDTTDVVRSVEVQNRDLLRAVVCLSRRFVSDVTKLSRAFDVPVL
jgi:hypothetical protein